jgi:hypothetical protein
MDPSPSRTDLCDQAKARYNSGEFEQASLLWNQALALDDSQHCEPQQHTVRHNIAACHLQLRQPMKALEAVNRALQKGGEGVAKYYSTKGNALFKLGRFEEAVEACSQGLVRDPAHSGCQECLAAAKTAVASPPRAAAPPRAGGSGGGSGRAGGGGGSGEVYLGADGFPVVRYPKPEPLPAPVDLLLALRVASLLCAAAYVAPLGAAVTAPAWRLFLVLTAAANVFVGWRAAVAGAWASRPAVSWANRAALGEWAVKRFMDWSCDLGLPPVALPLMVLLMAPRPAAFFAFAALPAVALNLFYVTEKAAGVLPAAAGAAVGAVGDVLAPAAAGKVGEARRQALLHRVAQLGAQGEVLVLLMLVLLLATPARSVVGVLFLGQLQLGKFVFNPFTREAFRGLDARVRGVLRRGPGLLLQAYDKGAKLAYDRATAILGSRRP